jgi:hypothetical protein
MDTSRLGEIAKVVTQHCMDCIGIGTTGQGYDCRSRICPLSPIQPFWGRKRAGIEVLTPERKRKRARPTKAHVSRCCKECLSEGEKDCAKTDCALYSWRPFQPGGQPKRKQSQAETARNEKGAQHLNSIRKVEILS